MTLLKLQNVAASYGASKALFDVNLSLSEGEVLALLGRNGMGKSTTVKTICRMMSATGTLTFDNQDLHRLACHKVAPIWLLFCTVG